MFPSAGLLYGTAIKDLAFAALNQNIPRSLLRGNPIRLVTDRDSYLRYLAALLRGSSCVPGMFNNLGVKVPSTT